MAAKPIDKSVSDAILIDWRLGRLSQQDIAEKYKVSKGSVNKICKGVDRDIKAIVTAQVEINQALSSHDDRMVTAVHDEVDFILQHKKFFDDAHIMVAKVTIDKLKIEDVDASFQDLSAAANTISKAREGVLGKSPEVSVTVGQAVQVFNHTPEQIRKINEELENAC